jgi:hypothetical protein
LTIGAIFQAGLFVGDAAAISPDTYNVVTQQQPIDNARIIRSSSSGFILFVDGKAMFVPQSEIVSVKSNRAPSDRY